MGRTSALVAALVVATGMAGLPPAGADAPVEAVSTRIVYSSDWTGPSQLFAVDPSGRAPVGQVTFDREPGCLRAPAQLPCGFSQPSPSPDGRWIAYRDRGGALWLARADGSGAQRILAGEGATIERISWVSTRPPRLDFVARVQGGGRDLRSVRGDGSGGRVVFRCAACVDPVRSPDGRATAFVDRRGLLVRRGKKVVRVGSGGSALAWSPDGRRIGFVGSRGEIEIISAVGGPGPIRLGPATTGPAWSPDGRRIAFASRAGLRVHELRTRRTRLLTRETAHGAYARPLGFVWSPDGRSLAYIPGNADVDSVRSGPLRVVTLAGITRTVVAADAAYGGRILSVAWSRVPAAVRYRDPDRVSRGIFAGGPVARLAADGERVAFESCRRVSVWSSDTGALMPTRIGSVGPASECSSAPWGIYSLALAGARLGYATKPGRCTMSANVESLAPVGATVELGRNLQCSPQSYVGAVGHFAGDGSLLVFSTWSEVEAVAGTYRTTTQRVLRVPSGGCPCPEVASSPGPLVPADVDADRVVAFGTNETLLLDADGRTLLSLPVSPLAAQLSSDELVLLLRGRLRVYAASSGVLRHEWPLPDVPSGGDGGSPRYEDYRLELHDAARGLAAYVFDGRVHVLRLSDGVDAVVGYGTSARFLDSGLVYADHSRIHLVAYEQLPVR